MVAVKETARAGLFFLGLMISIEANASVEVEVMPKESMGNPVTLRFTLKNEKDYEMLTAPEGAGDWQILGPQETRNSRFSYVNGEAKQESSLTITYLLKPLRVGQLKVPLVQIKVNNRVYSSPNTSIRVAKLGVDEDRMARPRPRNRPSFPLFPLDEEPLSPQIPQQNGQRQLDVAVVAEPSKTEVYTGELVLLPFYIYTNENIFRNLEFASFPSFKDFIKEELYLPKNWRTERVNYRGATVYKAEIIRFALFPVKSGELLIDPLKMRFEVDTDLFDMMQELFGATDPAERKPNTFSRSSGSIPVVVKPLPPKPLEIKQDEIAVGQYSLSIQSPPDNLVQNQPFNLKIRVEGRGNIKGIPEPDLSLPATLQKGKTETDYSMNTVAEGYKDFELLIVPRQSGLTAVPESSWYYFDPDKANYVGVKIPSIELKIAPSDRAVGEPSPVATAQDKLFAGEQEFFDRSALSLPPWLWTFPAFLYALAGFFFLQRKRQEKELALLGAKPWIRVERKIAVQHDLSSMGALGLVEEWILCRFRVLDMEESAFHDLMDSLQRKVPETVAPKILRLRQLFSQIESARFGGKNSSSLNLKFEEIRSLCEEIISSYQKSLQLREMATEEESDDA